MPTLVITRSTELLEQTAAACQHFLAQPTPPLNRDTHISFLTKLGLATKLPRGYTVLDASRTWIMYWTLNALKNLGADISSQRERLLL
jgi:prenyltransferase beta subunit